MALPTGTDGATSDGPYFHAKGHEVVQVGNHIWNCKTCKQSYDPDELHLTEPEAEKPIEVEHAQPTASDVSMGERLANQVKASDRWLRASARRWSGTTLPHPETEAQNRRGRPALAGIRIEGNDYDGPHPGVWLTPMGNHTSGVSLGVANKLVGISNSSSGTGPLDHYDLYAAYKSTPHAPASVFLKYLVHRHNNVEAYEDPEQGHKLDKEFLRLSQAGGAGDKNLHVSIQDLHDWTARHATTVMPQLLTERAKLHGEVARGVGLNKRYINGEPYVALARGLNSDLMKDEHALSSHADKPDTGFGSDMHTAWVPVKDLWYSYDLGARKSYRHMWGSEDEWLVSNTLPRYEAAQHDVKKGRMREWPEVLPRVYEDMQDDELAAIIDKRTEQIYSPYAAKMGVSVPTADEAVSVIRNHPNAGPAVYRAMVARKEKLEGNPGAPIMGYFGHHWFPADQVAAHALSLPKLDSPSWLRNPGLTPQHLEALAPKVFTNDPWNQQAAETVDALVNHPSMNSHVLERIARTQHGSQWLPVLLRAPIATHQMREDALAQVEFGAFPTQAIAVDALRAVTQNPHHTEEQAKRAYDWAVKEGLYRPGTLSLLDAVKHAKLPLDVVRGMFNRKKELGEEATIRNAARGFSPTGHLTPDEIAEKEVLKSLTDLYSHSNPHAAPVLARLAEEGHFSLENARSRMRGQGDRLEPELQPAYIRAAQQNSMGVGTNLNVHLDELAASNGLTQESISYLANHLNSDIRNSVFLNKRVTPEQIREAYPKSYKFPETDPNQSGGGYPYTESAVVDSISQAYWRRKNYADKRLREHIIKPLPQNLAKSSVDLWQAQARDWLANQGIDGFYLLTHKDLADGIIRDRAIEPQFTEDLLEGEAVIALPARPVNLEKLRRQAGPDDVVLYFETEVEPQEQDNGSVYWTARVPCEVCHIADVGEQPLAKFHTPLLFPKLGVGDDRRETKVVDSPLKRKTFFRAAMAQGVRENFTDDEENEKLRSNPSYREQVLDHDTKKASKLTASGATYEGLAGEGHPGYQTPRADRDLIESAGTGQHAISAAFTMASMPRRKLHPQHVEEFQDPRHVPQVLHHEDLHRIFSRIQHLHGEKEREMLARNLVMALPQDLRSAMMVHLFYAQPEYQTHPHPEEEAITELGSYLNQPQVRDNFHRHQQHTPEKQKAFHDKMKRAYRLLQTISPTVDQDWLHRERPWLNKGEALHKFHEPQGYAQLSAQAAHEVFRGSNKLSKAQPDLLDPNLFAFRFETDPKLYDAVVERHQELALRKMAVVHDDPTKPATVYRVEDVDTGQGPYFVPGEKETPPRGQTAADRAKFPKTKKYHTPEPETDFSASDYRDWQVGHRKMRFGFLSRQDAYNWFGRDLEGAIGEQEVPPNYKVVKVLASKVWKSRSGKQVLFVPHTPIKKSEADVVLPGEQVLRKGGEPGYLDDNRPLWWHGTPSGDLRGGTTGLHVGSRKAAEDALHARVGVPVEGTWDGSREYGKTLLAGKKTLRARGIYPTGYSSRAPEEDHFPTGAAAFSDGTPVLPTHKPSIFPLRITGQMSNTWRGPHKDFAANGRMASLLRRGSAKSGYYYRNDGEDAGSISAVLPGPSHVTLGDWDVKKSEADIVLPGEQVLGPGEESAAKMFLGHRRAHETALAAARFLVGRREPVDEDMFRLALGVYDGDHERAALIAVGLTDSGANLKALRAALKLGEFSPDHTRELTKNEPGTPHIESVNPGAPDAHETAAEVQRGVTAGLVQPLKLGGKHSKGSMAVRDPKTGNTWLLKPGAGKASPAAGVRDGASSQSAREAAFWHCMDRVGLGNYGPKCDLLEVNGGQVAAMKLLGTSWKSADEQNRKVDGWAREILQPYLDRGDVHRIAALFWALGESDAHGQNVLVHAESIALIDHGSSFAGPNFNPGRDTKSFTPYILRVFAPSGYTKKKPEDRIDGLPVLTPAGDAALKKWVASIDPAGLSETMGSHGIGDVEQGAVLARLADLQHHRGPSLSRYVNELWAGVVSPPSLR